MDVILKGKRLWKYVVNAATTDTASAKTRGAERATDAKVATTKETAVLSELSDSETQKNDLALAYILTSIDGDCKGMVRTKRCLVKACETFKRMFKAASESALDAKLSKLQNIQ